MIWADNYGVRYMLLKNQYHKLKNKFHVEAAFSFSNFTLLNGIFLIGFAMLFNANNLQIGILLAIPLFANLVQLFSAYILETTGTKKYTAIISLLLGKGLWVIIILISFGIARFPDPIFILGIILLFSSLFNAIGSLSLLSWMKDIVPLKKLARFWGKRNIYASLAGMIVYLGGAYFIDKYKTIESYGILFSIALLLGVIALISLFKIPERQAKIKAINPAKFLKRLSMPFKCPTFKPLLMFGLIWGFAINFAAPFFLVYMLDDMALGFLIVSIFLVIDTVARIYGLSIWRLFADRIGARPLLAVCATVTSIVPLAFVFINKNNYLLIPVIFTISAISYAGVDIAVSQVLFKSAPRKYDAYFLSAFTSLTGLVSAFGPIAGGAVALLLRTNSHLLPVSFPVLKYVFILSFMLRVSCLPLISKIYEPKARDIGDILDKVKTLRFFSFFANIYSISNYASKIVLVPQKQLFILRRKTYMTAKTSIVSILSLMSRFTILLNKAQKGIMHPVKIKEIMKEIIAETEKLDFVIKGELKTIPAKILSRVGKINYLLEQNRHKAVKQEAQVMNKSVKADSKILAKALGNGEYSDSNRIRK